MTAAGGSANGRRGHGRGRRLSADRAKRTRADHCGYGVSGRALAAAPADAAQRAASAASTPNGDMIVSADGESSAPTTNQLGEYASGWHNHSVHLAMTLQWACVSRRVGERYKCVDELLDCRTIRTSHGAVATRRGGTAARPAHGLHALRVDCTSACASACVCVCVYVCECVYVCVCECICMCECESCHESYQSAIDSCTGADGSASSRQRRHARSSRVCIGG
jgi:hypothetical protein